MESFEPQHPAIPFCTPKLSGEIEREVIASALKKLAERTVANIPAENYFQFDHGKDWNYLVYDEHGKATEATGQMQLKSVQLAIPTTKIMQQDRDLINESVNTITDTMGREMNDTILEKMRANAQDSGTMFSIPPSGISIEQYYDIIEKCCCTVSRDGGVVRPFLQNVPLHLLEKLKDDLNNAPSAFKAKLNALWLSKETEARKLEEARIARFDIVE
jgi:hypothetical protein